MRREGGYWLMAAIRPAGKRDVWALPKGRIDEGETGEETALREVGEETGVQGRSLGKLGDVRYWFHWEGERVFKVVSFFLLAYESGGLGDIDGGVPARDRRGRVAAARRRAATAHAQGRARDGRARRGASRRARGSRMIGARCRRTP